AGWIHQQVIDGELRARKQRCRTQEESGSRDVSGNGSLDGVELLASDDPCFVSATADFRSKGAQRQLSVVTGAYRLLDHSFAIRQQPGKQHTGLDLRASQGHAVVNRFQMSSANAQWRAISRSCGDLRTHGR